MGTKALTRRRAPHRRHGRETSRRAAFIVTALALLGLLGVILLLAAPEGAGAAAPGKISGKVVSAATHAAVAGVGVTALRKYVPDAVWPNDFRFEEVRHATTAKNGTYTIARLPAGTYHVEFRPASLKRYALETWPDTAALACGGEVVVGSGQTRRGIGAPLDPSGRLQGTVIDAATRLSLANVRVMIAYQAPGLVAGEGYVTTDADASYEIGGIAPGKVRLGVTDPPLWRYARTFYGGALVPELAADVSVAARQATQVADIALSADRGSIRGFMAEARRRSRTPGCRPW